MEQKKVVRFDDGSRFGDGIILASNEKETAGFVADEKTICGKKLSKINESEGV